MNYELVIAWGIIWMFCTFVVIPVFIAGHKTEYTEAVRMTLKLESIILAFGAMFYAVEWAFSVVAG